MIGVVDNTTLVMVVRNEMPRLEQLLVDLKPWFEEIVIGVQDSTDDTLAVAQRYATMVVTDQARGFGDATYPLVQRAVTRRWAFRLDGDERPTEDLLISLAKAGRYCEDNGLGGLWIPFRSWIEDVEWEQPHAHLRFWDNRWAWPPTLHSRPNPDRTEQWPIGFIEHRKSLDEHVEGYLGYLAAGRGNVGWDAHNLLMLRSAIEGTGVPALGWDEIEQRPWWPEVLRVVYNGQRPSGPVPSPEP